MLLLHNHSQGVMVNLNLVKLMVEDLLFT